MTLEQGLIFGVLALTMLALLWGRWRHDVVALGALMLSVLLGLVPTSSAFVGFSHPAVITVACVLVLSQGLQTSGAVDLLARSVLPQGAGRATSVIALAGLGALLSGFMNNVGAMALLMPVAVQIAGRIGLSSGQVLMPLAFGTILGGMTTLVGTPPNLIVSGFRAEAGLGPYSMFAFTPVGLSVALVGVLFIAVVGWRLVPVRKPTSEGDFQTGSYLTEFRVPESSKVIDMTLRQIERDIRNADVQILGLVRQDVRMHAPHGGTRVRAGDVLVMEADVEGLAEVLSALGIEMEETESGSERESSDPADADTPSRGIEPDTDGHDAGTENGDGSERKPPAVSDAAATFQRVRDVAAMAGRSARKVSAKPGDKDSGKPRGDDIVLRELAVLPGASIIDNSATDMRLRTRYGLNLLAVSREGRRPKARLRTLRLRSGDLLLMQGPAEVISDFANEAGCVPLGERALRLPDRRKAVQSVAILAGAVVLVTAGLLPAAVAFTLAVLASMLLRTVPPRKVYTAIDWPVIVLLAALIPVAGAMQQTGAADLLASGLVETVAQGQPIAALVVLMVVTMFLSDVMNNAATAAVMCPIALGIAAALGVNADSYLMAVAIGASCAFLTPIGHQNNTLILGPGGFRFGDYWRLGLPLEILVVSVSVPLLLLVWPL